MPNLYTIQTKKEAAQDFLTKGEKFSVIYHNLFDHPMSFSDMIRWRANEEFVSEDIGQIIENNKGYFFVEGKKGIIYKKALRRHISVKKVEIAKKAAEVLSFIPGIKMVAVTGSLAMENSDDASDIDLMIITKAGTLWTTRLLVYLVIGLFGIQRRYPNDRVQKDRLCLNMWLDESDVEWHERNFYTAHEIAQIVPIINKDQTYERFLYKNSWIKNFWPNSVRISSEQLVAGSMQRQNPLLRATNYMLQLFEKLAFRIQYWHMRAKITREVITPTRALFHPQDWGKVVLDRLNALS